MKQSNVVESKSKVKINTAKREEQFIAQVVTIAPTIGFILAIFWIYKYGITLIDIALLLIMYSITNLGITAGFHRFFTHRSFQTGKVMQVVLSIAGSMAVQGPVLFWSAVHRRHHQYSDRQEDPHSPHYHNREINGQIKGLWHSHIGWMFNHNLENWMRYVPDLVRDKLICQISLWYFYWVLLGLLIPAISGGLLTQSWHGAISALLWGGFARIFLLHHVTWSINSICHLYGSRPYNTNDESRNNFVCALLAFGEGWHNNHHAFPASARHGLAWWQIDLTYQIISMLEKAGFIWDVNLPSAKFLAAKNNTL